jgi:hypothetical protein
VSGQQRLGPLPERVGALGIVDQRAQVVADVRAASLDPATEVDRRVVKAEPLGEVDPLEALVGAEQWRAKPTRTSSATCFRGNLPLGRAINTRPTVP